MARGGKRPGAGRPKGAKTKITEKALKEAGDGMTPLEFMLGILRDTDESMATRFEAAKAAAPYMHPRLSQVDSTVTHKRNADDLTDAELAAYLKADSGSDTAEETSGARTLN